MYNNDKYVLTITSATYTFVDGGQSALAHCTAQSPSPPAPTISRRGTPGEQ